MLNPDSNNEHFDQWLRQGLKKPQPVEAAFMHRVFNRLEEQKARRLLRRTALQMRIFGGMVWLLILSAIGALFWLPIHAVLLSCFQTLLEGLIHLIYQPTLMGILTPATVLVLSGIVVWNLVEMLSVE
jgi:cobalamin biosynthesis protein CobD/CbiB